MENTQIKVAQLTDLHFLDDKSDSVQGFNAYKHLNTIIKNSFLDQYDYIFLSGDISENGSIKSYELVKSILDKLDIPVYCIPGNHDNKNNMLSVFSESKHIQVSDRLEFSSWEILFLDTTVKGEIHGFLSSESLEKLRSDIEKSRATHVAIVMHHHPYETGIAHFDRANLKNSIAFRNLIKNTKVKLVTYGHVHNYYSMLFDAILYESTPAVIFQLKQKGTDLLVENKYGYKELIFTPEGVFSNCIWVSSNASPLFNF